MLIDTIKTQQLQARKSRDTALAQLLTTFYSEAAMIGKNDGDRTTTDKEVHAVAKKFIKNAKEVYNNLPDTDNRALEAVYEIDILGGYLPPQLSPPDLLAAIAKIVDDKNASTMKDMGVVMKELKAAFDGQYDGKEASAIIKGLL